MAYCAGVRRRRDCRTGVDEMVDWDIIIIFRRNVFVSLLSQIQSEPPLLPHPSSITNRNQLTPTPSYT